MFVCVGGGGGQIVSLTALCNTSCLSYIVDITYHSCHLRVSVAQSFPVTVNSIPTLGVGWGAGGGGGGYSKIRTWGEGGDMVMDRGARKNRETKKKGAKREADYYVWEHVILPILITPRTSQLIL